MIKCMSCGYENDDGSQICLNCRESLDQNLKQTFNAEKHIGANQEAFSGIEKTDRKTGKTTTIVFVSILIAAILGVVIYFANLNKPVVDTKLLGSWQTAGYGYTDVWTFEKDGTYSIARSGTGIYSDGLDVEDWHYKAEGGKLKISWSKNIDRYVSTTYEYQFGVSEDGRQCLILKQITGGGSTTEILYKVS